MAVNEVASGGQPLETPRSWVCDKNKKDKGFISLLAKKIKLQLRIIRAAATTRTYGICDVGRDYRLGTRYRIESQARLLGLKKFAAAQLLAPD